ncbi:MAG: penicillin-binding protein [Prevotella sp.]|nr:penicillin-binding protein [Prevotella sp.]
MKKYITKIAKYLKRCWTWYRNLYRRPWYVKLLTVIVTLIIAFVLYLVAVDMNFLWLFGKSPSMSEVKNTHPAEASLIYSADGHIIGKYFNENRSPVAYEDVNPVFWDALISTEDERFYKHRGIDFLGVAAAAKDYIVHHDARGASTITQQLAKNLFRVRTQYSTGGLGYVPGLKILVMKSKEWITAAKLEYNFSKEEILTMYANTVDFGSNSFGIKAACKTYFGTTPRELTADQAAILVGMLKATTYYNPRINPDNSLRRRNVVLNNMVTHGHLTQEAYDTLKLKPVKLKYSVESNYDGQALYFRKAVYDQLRDWCKENDYDLYTDGLKVYTTLDTRLQRHAEQAVTQQMREIQNSFDTHWGNANPWRNEYQQEMPHFIEDIARRLPCYEQLMEKYEGNEDSVNYYLNLPHTVKLFDYEQGTIEKEMSTMDSIRYMVRFMHCSLVAMEPATGHIKAWVGDIDFNSWKYDKVTAKRQPGSTFKLFVYTEAMNQGMTPCDRRRDAFFSMKVKEKDGSESLWAPTNADGHFSGADMPLKSAFAQSINSVAVRVAQEVGIDKIAATAHAMGIESQLDPTPALSLGSSDVSLLELVSSYSTIVNDGKHRSPVLVTRILDRDGNEIYTVEDDSKQVVPQRSAFLMQQMLMDGMREAGGTSQSMWRYVRPFQKDTDFGGKTGTSNNHSDAWFIGTIPQLVTGVWVGGEYRCIHFRTGQLGQGNRTALPVCGVFMKSVMEDPVFKHYHTKYAKPAEGMVSAADYACQGVYYVHSEADATDDDDSSATDGTEGNDAVPVDETNVERTVPTEKPSPKQEE